MIWYFLIGALAAFGLLCAVWVCVGSLLSRRGTVAILCDGGEEALVRRCRWLRELGLIGGRILLINSRLSPQRQQQIREKTGYIDFCTLSQWCDRQNEERKDRV